MSAKDTPMLHAEHQTNEGRRWEESGKIPEGDESTALFSQAAVLSYAANVGEQAGGGWGGKGWGGGWGKTPVKESRKMMRMDNK